MPENLKNVLLVMSSGGFLTNPTQDPGQEKIWVETWKRIDRFLPNLRKELDLDEAALPGETNTPDKRVKKPVVERVEDST